MEMNTIFYIVGGVVVLIIFFKLFLNKPSKEKLEHERRMRELKKKKLGKYDEVRPLNKDRKKYS